MRVNLNRIMKTQRLSCLIRLAGFLLFFSQATYASDSAGPVVEIHFADGHFVPEKLSVQAGSPFVIKVVNLSSERIEFESFKLNREKVVEPGKTILVKVPALRPGTYDFFDDFNEKVPEGSIVAQ